MTQHAPFCEIKRAEVAQRLFNPPFLGTLGIGLPLYSPLPSGSVVLTFGDGTPRQYWLNLYGRSQQFENQDAVTQENIDRNAGRSYPNPAITRALITLDGEPPLTFVHDFRGEIITPPTLHGTVTLLGPNTVGGLEQSVRFDKVGLPADAANNLIIVDSLSLAAHEVATPLHAAAVSGAGVIPGRQSRGQMRSSIVERFSVFVGQNAQIFLPLNPWCRRFRFRETLEGGSGSLDFRPVYFAGASAVRGDGVLLDTSAQLGRDEWMDASGYIGLRPIFTGNPAAFWSVHVEQECFL